MTRHLAILCLALAVVGCDTKDSGEVFRDVANSAYSNTYGSVDIEIWSGTWGHGARATFHNIRAEANTNNAGILIQ